MMRGNFDSLEPTTTNLSPDDISRFKEASDAAFLQLQKSTASKSQAWERIFSKIKDMLFYNKSNLKDVCDLVLYVRGVRHHDALHMCERLTSTLGRRELEVMLRDLSLQDLIVQQAKLNLNFTGELL